MKTNPLSINWIAQNCVFGSGDLNIYLQEILKFISPPTGESTAIGFDGMQAVGTRPKNTAVMLKRM